MRIFPLLLLCLACFLGPGVDSAAAHDTRPVRSEPSAINSTLSLTAIAKEFQEDDCPSQQACCQVTCAPCKLPLAVPASQILRIPTLSVVFPHLDSLWRSIVLGRDPPVPRSRG